MTLLDDLHFDQDKIRPIPAPPKKPRRRERFIRGPIPAKWMERAACLPGKALHVATMVRYLDGFQGTGTVQLRPSVRDAYGVDRFASARALTRLEEAGLVSVARRRGAAPTVTILDEETVEGGDRTMH